MSEDNAAPSSTEPTGIVGEMMSEFHKLEEKVEHLIHHQEGAGSAAPGEILIPAIPLASGSDATAADANSISTIAVEQSSATSAAMTPSSDLGNGSGAVQPAMDGSAIATNLDASLSTQTSPETTLVTGDLPTDAIGAVAGPVITASGPGASIPAGIPGIVETAVAEPAKLVSSISSAVLNRIAAIKKHLSIRGFEQSAVADIHSELDAIERLL